VPDADRADRDSRPDPLAAVPWPLRTTRLEIRRATGDDVATTWPYRRLPEVSEWMTGGMGSLEEYTEKFGDPVRLAKTLILELGGEVVGDLMVAVEDGWAQSEVRDQARGVQAELGWCLAPAHQGRGLAGEAVRELLRLCFEDLGLRRVTANCFAGNEASWRMMERLGMRREIATRAESLHREWGWVDGLGYALLAEEWRARRG
jgi:RimJ/RimL family protein N-acetyltransferase